MWTQQRRSQQPKKRTTKNRIKNSISLTSSRKNTSFVQKTNYHYCNSMNFANIHIL